MKTPINALILTLVGYSFVSTQGHAMPMADQPAPTPEAISTALPISTTTPQATQPLPAPTTTPIAIPQATTPIPAPSNAPQEVTQINQIIDDIINTKKALKDQIKQLDDKLIEARTEVATMRKSSSDILSKGQETDAQAVLGTINTGLEKISATQAFINGDFSRTFDGNIAKIQSLIQQGQTVIQTLQTKGYQQQIAQAQITTIEEKEVAKEQAAKAAKTQQESTLDPVTEFFANVVRKIKKIGISIKTIFSAEPQDIKVSQGGEKKNSNEPIADQSTPVVVSNISAATQNLITSQLNEADLAMQKLDDQQKNIAQQMLSLEQSTTSVINNLKGSNPTKEDQEKDPKWKQVAMLITSNLLDAAAFVVTGIKDAVIYVYNYLFAGIVNRFVSDVKEKVNKDEKPSKGNVPAQGLLPIEKTDVPATPPSNTPAPVIPAPTQQAEGIASPAMA